MLSEHGKSWQILFNPWNRLYAMHMNASFCPNEAAEAGNILLICLLYSLLGIYEDDGSDRGLTLACMVYQVPHLHAHLRHYPDCTYVCEYKKWSHYQPIRSLRYICVLLTLRYLYNHVLLHDLYILQKRYVLDDLQSFSDCFRAVFC